MCVRHLLPVPGAHTRVLTRYILTYIAQVYMLCTVYSHTNRKHGHFYMCTTGTYYSYRNTIHCSMNIRALLHSRKELAAKI